MRLVLAAFIVVAGCNNDKPASNEAKPAAAPAPAAAAPAAAAPAAAPGVPNAAAQIAQMQKAMAAAGVAQQKPAVNWRELVPVLGDDLGGWKAKGETKGETNSAAGMTVSQVERSYEKDGKQVHVQIADTAVMPMLAQAFQMARMASTDASDHYARPIDFGGNPGWDEWHKGGSVEVTALVAGRFLVKATSSGLDDSKPLAAVIKGVDLGKLSALNK